jgi:hypothetical protein
MGAWLNLAMFGASEAARIRAEHPGIYICGAAFLPYLLFGFLAGVFVTGTLLFGLLCVAAYFSEDTRTAQRMRTEKTRAWLLDS